MTEAGSPKLNRHVPREEAQARIEAAVKVARQALVHGRADRDPNYVSQFYEDQIERIVDLLEAK